MYAYPTVDVQEAFVSGCVYMSVVRWHVCHGGVSPLSDDEVESGSAASRPYESRGGPNVALGAIDSND